MASLIGVISKPISLTVHSVYAEYRRVYIDREEFLSISTLTPMKWHFFFVDLLF